MPKKKAKQVDLEKRWAEKMHLEKEAQAEKEKN